MLWVIHASRVILQKNVHLWHISNTLILNLICFNSLQLLTPFPHASWLVPLHNSILQHSYLLPEVLLHPSAILAQIYCFSSRDSNFTDFPTKLLKNISISFSVKEFKSPVGLVLLRNMSKTCLQWNHWPMQSPVNIPLPCWSLHGRGKWFSCSTAVMF